MYQKFTLAAMAAASGLNEWQFYDAGFFFLAIPVVFIYGICIGSFLNVVIIRVPRGESLIKRSAVPKSGSLI